MVLAVEPNHHTLEHVTNKDYQENVGREKKIEILQIRESH